MKKIALAILSFLFCAGALLAQNKVAVVISRTSYFARQSEVGSAAKSWTAICNLAGLPYSTLFVEDLNDSALKSHSAVVLCQCNFLTDAEYSTIQKFLEKASKSGYGVLVDGPVGTYDESEDFRDELGIDKLLGIVKHGDASMDGFRLRVADNAHFITNDYGRKEMLSNLLSSELPVLALDGDSRVLVNVSDDVHTYPYESVKTDGKLNVAVINGLSHAAALGASFRNYAPKGFFPSKVYPLLRKTLQWCVNGDTQKAFPSLLLSDGNMTAFIRVDGDGSQAPASMDMCMTYLEDIALESGVQGVMTYVSAWATRAGWHFYVDHSRKLQELGTAIGTHSMNHRLSELETEEEFSYELDGSKKEIRDNHVSRGYDVGEIRYLVNPGNTLAMHHLDQVRKRFDFFMTHGQDQYLPVAYGNINWFTGGKPLPMVDDSPSPDYQWFYDSEWSHTTAEVANYENLVLDHLYNTVGNGVVFDAMWHDYGMSKMLIGEPRNVTKIMREGTRIINDNNQEYYETIRNFWNTHDVYCPEPAELAAKLTVLSNATITWTAEADALTANISFAKDDFAKYAKYIGGMAIGMNNTEKAISAVEIDGKPYLGFSDEKVILPVPQKRQMTIKVTLGGQKPESRVIYSSKILSGVSSSESGLTASVISHSMSRVKFETSVPSVVIGATWFETAGTEVEARLLGSGDIKLMSNDSAVTIHSASLPIKSFKKNADGSVDLVVCGNGKHHNTIVASSASMGRKVIDIAELNGEKTITLK